MSWKAYLKCFKFLEDIFTPDIFRMKALMGETSILWLGWRRDLWIFLWVDVAFMLTFIQICAVWWHCMSRAIRERETDRFGEHVFEGIKALNVFEQQTYVLLWSDGFNVTRRNQRQQFTEVPLCSTADIFTKDNVIIPVWMPWLQELIQNVKN